MTPKGFFEYAKKNQAKMIDLKFTDMLGTWQHCSFPTEAWGEEIFEDGVGFDGSSIRGWQDIHVSDMLAVPEAGTACMDPFFAEPTVSVIANIVDPMSRKDYTRCPRYIARKGIAYLEETGLADVCYIGPEPEFFIFDEVRYAQNQHQGLYQIDSVEGAWNTARFEEPNLGYKPGFKGGYFPVSPTDTYHDLRGEMSLEMMKVGLQVECHHHEVGTAGQTEIDLKYEPLLKQADNFMWYKYIVKNVAKRAGKTVTFMPKPVFEDNGSGMHTHFSLWRNSEPLFAGDKYAGLSDMALHAAGGILKHAASLLAFAAPTTNSYRRLVPGFEAPVNLVMSAQNRSASIRIPMYSDSPKAKRLEFRCPDPTCNPYLTWTAILMAALDGIQNQISPGEPLDRDIYEMSPEELENYRHTPKTLSKALDALTEDHAFLLAGGVFTDDLIETWIKWKREKELQEIAIRPHPYEFHLYYDC
ncbi:MAG: type I glutamate--ammonia ligase [Planctomycetes bacterium]|nr:type I glutamate--ammonia ligase [Planctomycetota bacterium]